MNIYALVCGKAVKTASQQDLLQEGKINENAFSIVLKTGIFWDESIQVL